MDANSDGVVSLEEFERRCTPSGPTWDINAAVAAAGELQPASARSRLGVADLSSLVAAGPRGDSVVRQLFNHVTRHGATMSHDDFCDALKLLGMRDAEVADAAWRRVDVLDTGKITIADFRRVFAPPAPPLDFVSLSLQRLRRLVVGVPLRRVFEGALLCCT